MINHRISIPAEEIDIQFTRSGGPGGQNVNKLNTKVILKWRVVGTAILPEGWRDRVVSRHRNRINEQGELVVRSERYRIQRRNLEDCRQKLRELILDCQAPPQERVATKPSFGSRMRRLDEKNRRSEKKRLRRPNFGD